MAEKKKTMHPNDFMKELKLIGQEISTTELTPAEKEAILEELKKMEALLLDMRKQFSKESLSAGNSA